MPKLSPPAIFPPPSNQPTKLRRRPHKRRRRRRKYLARIRGALEISCVAVIVDVVALVAPEEAVRAAGRGRSGPARLGLVVAVFARGPAAVLVGVRGELETAPIGVFHDAAGWFEAFGLGGIG